MGLSEQDAFLSHLGMCMMTLWELGLAVPRGARRRRRAWSPWAATPRTTARRARLLAYIRATHQRSDAGFTLKRMEWSGS